MRVLCRAAALSALTAYYCTYYCTTQAVEKNSTYRNKNSKIVG